MSFLVVIWLRYECLKLDKRFEEPDMINATLDNIRKELKTNFYSVLVSFLLFKLLEKAKNMLNSS